MNLVGLCVVHKCKHFPFKSTKLYYRKIVTRPQKPLHMVKFFPFSIKHWDPCHWNLNLSPTYNNEPSTPNYIALIDFYVCWIFVNIFLTSFFQGILLNLLKMPSLSDLRNLFPTKLHAVIFVGYMALFINQGNIFFCCVVDNQNRPGSSKVFFTFLCFVWLNISLYKENIDIRLVNG